MRQDDPRIAMKEDPDAYNFGACRCGLPAWWGYNVGRDHWFYCDECRTRWVVGSNLFGNWREETEADWAANRKRYGDYTKIEVHFPEWVLEAWAIRNAWDEGLRILKERRSLAV